MHREPAKIIVNTKSDWVRIVGIIVLCLLLLSILVVQSLPWAIIALVVVVGGFAVLRQRILEPFFWSNPEAHFYSWPLTLGSDTSVDYVRRRKRGTPSDGPIGGWAAVTCTEIATYSVGTSTYTDKATAYVDRFDARGQISAGEVRVPIVVSIPVHAGAPSMNKPNNEIRWDLAARFDGMVNGDNNASFRLPVAAVLTDRSDRSWSESA